MTKTEQEFLEDAYYLACALQARDDRPGFLADHAVENALYHFRHSARSYVKERKAREQRVKATTETELKLPEEGLEVLPT